MLAPWFTRIAFTRWISLCLTGAASAMGRPSTSKCLTCTLHRKDHGLDSENWSKAEMQRNIPRQGSFARWHTAHASCLMDQWSNHLVLEAKLLYNICSVMAVYSGGITRPCELAEVLQFLLLELLSSVGWSKAWRGLPAILNTRCPTTLIIESALCNMASPAYSLPNCILHISPSRSLEDTIAKAEPFAF